MGEPLRAAVVGLGVAGAWAVEALDRLDGVSCVAGVDPRGSQAPGAELLAGPVHGAIAELAEHGRLDLIVISVGSRQHAAAALAALELKPTRLWIEKPRATTAAQAAALWAAQPETEVRTMLHRAYAGEIMHTLAALDGWRAQHGPLAAIESIFIDRYGGDEAAQGSLGDCWLDSGINALSAVGAMVSLGELRNIIGELPLCATASISFTDGASSGTLTLRTAWIEGRSSKTSVLRFTDGATLTLEHNQPTVTLRSPDGRELAREQFAVDLGVPRYSRMFASYLADDRQAPTPELDRQLHELLLSGHERLL